MLSLKSRVLKLESEVTTSDEEHLLFMYVLGKDDPSKTLMSIADLKRHRSAQNTDNLSDDEFLRVTGEAWGVDLMEHSRDVGEPLKWKRPETIHIK